MPNKKEASVIAKIAFFLSIATAAFSVYQWWNSQRDARIHSAIEFSQDYARSHDQKKDDAVFSLIKGGKMNVEEISHIFNDAVELDYVAYLANNNRLEFDYLSPNLKCGIFQSNYVIGKLKSQANFVESFAEIAIFSKRVEVEARCKPNLDIMLNSN